MDVSSRHSIKSGVEFVSSNLQSDEGIWALINNAGIVGRTGPSEWLCQEDYQDLLNVNLFGIINTCQAFIPLLRKCRGRIINTSSIIGRIGLPGSGPYVASKFAVEGYSDVLRLEMTAFGISVHVVEPGFFCTPITNPESQIKLLSATWKRNTEEMRQIYGGEDYFKKPKTMGLKMCSDNLSPVLDSYEHAVTAVYPRGRYMPGWTAWLCLWPLTFMPEHITARLFKLPSPSNVNTRLRLNTAGSD